MVAASSLIILVSIRRDLTTGNETFMNIFLVETPRTLFPLRLDTPSPNTYPETNNDKFWKLFMLAVFDKIGKNTAVIFLFQTFQTSNFFV